MMKTQAIYIIKTLDTIVDDFLGIKGIAWSLTGSVAIDMLQTIRIDLPISTNG